MKRIAQAQIGAKTYTVYLCSDAWLKRQLGQDARGGCWPSAQKIFFAPHECLDAALDTYVHEILHAAIDAWGLDDRGEEARVRRFTPMTIATLRGAGLLRVPGWLRRVVI
jgi:hypothetical protein